MIGFVLSWRRGSELNRRMKVLQTLAVIGVTPFAVSKKCEQMSVSARRWPASSVESESQPPRIFALTFALRFVRISATNAARYMEGTKTFPGDLFQGHNVAMNSHKCRGRALSLNGVAARLRVHEKIARRLVTGGWLKAYRVGRQWRVLEADLGEYLAAHANFGEAA
jgi:excisionase family DNA binding protein